MNGYLSIKNWSEFQQYKDRDPKWIKLHRDILTDYEFDQLTEIQQNHLMKLWLLASRLDNKIPNDASWIGRQIGAKSKVDINQLVTSGFITLYGNVQNCTETYLETETETETEAEAEYVREMFDAWWEAYNKKVDRKKCEKKWNSLNWNKLNITPDDLIADAHNRHANCNKWREGYQPNPLTYLNGERWNDELQQPKREQSLADEYAARKRRSEAILSQLNDCPMGDDEPSLPPPMESHEW